MTAYLPGVPGSATRPLSADVAVLLDEAGSLILDEAADPVLAQDSQRAA